MKRLLASDRRRFALAAVLLVAVLLPTLHAQEVVGFAPSRAAEILEAVVADGIPVESVRQIGDRYEIVLPPASAGQLSRAEQIRDQVLARPLITIVVDNLQDALVVLRFEPNNASANALVRARYAELRRQAANR